MPQETQVDYTSMTGERLVQEAQNAWNQASLTREQIDTLGPVFHTLLQRVEIAGPGTEERGDGQQF